MILSSDQERAVKAIADWFRGGMRQVFYCYGYAGTGKTTLVRYAIDYLGLDQEKARFAAYTMKAASVMQKNGVPDAMTIHRLIYKPIDPDYEEIEALQKSLDAPDMSSDEYFEINRKLNQARRPRFALNDLSEISKARLVVLDEASMISSRVADDLISFAIPILVIGDPAQLPPIMDSKDRPGFMTDKPDVMLTEVHRQARDNQILRLATVARSGKPIEFGDYGDGVRKVRLREMNGSELLDADQVICGMNATRRRVNSILKRKAGFDGELPVGDSREKIIVRRNDYGVGIYNGQFVQLEKCAPDAEDDTLMYATIVDPDRRGHGELPFYTGHFMDHVRYDRDRKKDNDGIEIDWGWAITCHKAQGSGWPNVCVLNDGWGRTEEEKRRWLYTAITRAAEKLTIVE